MLGYTRAELIGANIIEIMVPDSYLEATWQNVKQRSTEPYRIELSRKDGSTFWAEMRGVNLTVEEGNTRVVIARDLTEYLAREQELAAASDRFERLFNISTSGILIHKDGVCRELNQHLANMLGYKKDELKGIQLLEVLFPKQYQELAAIMVENKSTEPYEVEVLCKDGSLIPVIIHSQHIDLDGEEVRITSIQDISSVKQAEEQLRASERKYRSVVESVDAAAFQMDCDGRVQFVNKMAEQILEVEQIQINPIGKTIDALVEDAALIQHFKAGIAHVNTHKTTYHQDYVYEYKGVKQVFALKFSPILGAKGKLLGIQGLATDISEVIRSREELDQQHQYMSSILDDLPVGVCTYDEKGQLLHANRKFLERWPGVTRKGNVEGFDLIAYLKRVDRDTANFYSSIIADPDHTEGATRILNVELADNIEVVLQESLYPLQTETTDRKQFLVIVSDITREQHAMQSLVDSEENYRLITQQVQDVVWSIDKNGQLVFVSPSCLTLTGYTNKELVGQYFWRLLDAKHIVKLYAKYRDNNQFSSTDFWEHKFQNVTLIRKDGTKVSIQGRIATKLNSQGDVVGFVGVSRDSTEQNIWIEQLNQRNSEVEMAMQLSKMGIWSWNASQGVIKLDVSMQQILDTEEPSLSYDEFMHFVIQEDRVFVSQAFRNAIQRKNEVEVEYRIVTRNDEVRYCRTKATMRKDRKEGMLLFTGVTLDITEKRKTEIALDEQRSNLRSMMEHTIQGFILLDQNANIIALNQSAIQFGVNTLGCDLKEGINIIPCIPKKDMLSFKHNLDIAFKGKAVSRDNMYTSEQGRTYWFEEHWNSVYNEEGKILAVNFNFHDITERIEHEYELKRVLKELTDFRNAIESFAILLITDKDGSITYVNDAFCEYYGYTKEEVVGKSPNILNADYHDEAFFKDLWETISAGKQWRGEVLNKRKDGSLVWGDSFIMPVLHEDKEIVAYLALKQDITERKKAEEKHKELTENLMQQNAELQNFAFITSHNLRSPVANILGLTSLFSAHADSVDIALEIVDRLQTSAKQLDEVVHDLNEIINVKNKGQLTMEAVTLREVYEEVKAYLFKDIFSFKYEIEEQLTNDLMVWSDKRYVRNILVNIMSNAVKFRSHKRDLKVTIKAFEEGDRATITIADNGMGMNVDKLFLEDTSIFARKHLSKDGHGLGLYYTKELLHSLGGELSLQSKIGKGTSVTIHLPLYSGD